MPLKVKTRSGYELLDDKQQSYVEKPRDVIDAGKYDFDRAASKDKSWQRRLLDLSLKNNLLNFRYKRDCLHILSSDLAAFCEKLAGKEKFRLGALASPIKDAAYFGGNLKSMEELISIEMKSGLIRTYSGQEALIDTSNTLIRKARSAEEETGTKTLYLALGF